MAASSLCRLQGLERTLAPAVNGAIVDQKSSILPLTNAIQLRKSSWGGLPLLPSGLHLEGARKACRKTPLVCRAETGGNNVAKQSTLGNQHQRELSVQKLYCKDWYTSSSAKDDLQQGSQATLLLQNAGAIGNASVRSNSLHGPPHMH